MNAATVQLMLTPSGCQRVVSGWHICLSGGLDWTMTLNKSQGLGIGQVKNGRLYLRYGSCSEKTTAKCGETVTDKKPCLYYCKKIPGVQLPHTIAEKNKRENLDVVILLSSSFFITHNSKTIICIWTFYTLNESSTSEKGDFSWLELHASHER